MTAGRTVIKMAHIKANRSSWVGTHKHGQVQHEGVLYGVPLENKGIISAVFLGPAKNGSSTAFSHNAQAASRGSCIRQNQQKRDIGYVKERRQCCRMYPECKMNPRSAGGDGRRGRAGKDCQGCRLSKYKKKENAHKHATKRSGEFK